MSFSWRRDDRLINRRVWVHFNNGCVSLRVLFWMPISAMIRDAKAAMLGTDQQPSHIEDDKGQVLWREERR